VKLTVRISHQFSPVLMLMLCLQVGYFPSAFVTESEDDDEPFSFGLSHR